jgi:molybdate transport system substrate-binding protein
MRKAALTIAMFTIVPLVFAVPAMAAEALEMQLHGGGHFQGAGQPLVEAFTAKTGIPATYVPGNTGDGEFLERIHAGSQIDVIVVNSAEMPGYVAGGVMLPGTDVVFAEDGYGLATLRDRPMPDISTVEKLRDVLLNARAVGRREASPTSNSGRIANQFLIDLGIHEQMQGEKTVFIDNANDALESGQVDYVIWSYTEILRNDALHGAAMPRELGGFVTQAVAIPVGAKRIDEARQFIEFMTSPEGGAVLHQWGMELVPQD